jgi:hypothetical protein
MISQNKIAIDPAPEPVTKQRGLNLTSEVVKVCLSNASRLVFIQLNIGLCSLIHPRSSFIFGDYLAWPLVVGALLVIAKRGAQLQTLADILCANCAGTPSLCAGPLPLALCTSKVGLRSHSNVAPGLLSGL